MVKMAGIWSPRENAVHWISNDSLAKISHNYPYTANTVDLNITKAKGRGLAMFVRGVMPLDGISCLLIQMFLSGESEETAEIKARTITTTRQLYWMQRKYIILVHSHYRMFRKSYSGQAVWECYILSPLCINSPCMLILKRFWEWYICHHFMIIWEVINGYGLVCSNKTRKCKNCRRASCLQIWNVSITTIAYRYQFYN